MDAKALAMFAHLAQSLHFGKTAEAFYVSPSTLSRVVQRLEDELGCKLLHRDNRNVVLTQAGEKLQDYALLQQSQLEGLKLDLAKQQVQLTGKLHIYCSVTAAYSHLPDLLDRFRQQHPMVEIMLSTGDAADAVSQIQQQSVDIAIAAKPDELSSSFYFHHLSEIELQLIAPAMVCPVEQLVSRSHIDWAKVPIILPEQGLARTRFEKWFRQLHYGKPSIYANVSGHEAIVSMVALGCGVGIAPQVVTELSPLKNRVKVLDIKTDIKPFDLGVCCLNIKKQQPLVKAFFDAINTP
ncbi:HTH-type transcriptional activator IlvY [Thalassotalea sp. LPB0316]|uniref:HTH-type transcriptional activator IlvY n=1 Tax=Thalassotalea sp. LPB0316 TaxID=2769490 RepID=UPI0018664765|nr:HTH-type transcriptional activator IlvY [Thalassotalea sp. LPB0316]QOL26273.1 HTH-type transcriptional activator IlvY [Thalassotalea sp. LPB0316]